MHEGEIPGRGPWRDALTADRFPTPEEARSIGDRLAEVATEHAGRTALSSPSGTWTFGELWLEVQRGASALLAELGDGARRAPRPVVVLAAHDGPLVTTILAIIAAGQIVVVLDPVAPVEQSSAVLDEIGPTLLVHDDAHVALVGTLVRGRPAVQTVALSSLQADPVELPRREPSDPMMLAFTSGTSGTPKGAVITHGVLLNLVRGATDVLGVTAEDRMPMLFPTSMAVAAYPMFIPLLNGATLATLDVRGVGLEPVADFLEKERITLAYMAPTVVRFLVDALAGRAFPDMRMVALGGEVVDAEVVALTAELFTPQWLANGFGTTETGVITLYVIDPASPPEGAVPAGHPVQDVELFVIDDDGTPLPAGESGEVAVASPYLFDGYWGHPELTAQVLAPDPAGRPGRRLYRTGDLGRLDEHGALVVLGRSDTKVKVRGRFVVLGEVESALHELDEVADAAVVASSEAGIVSLAAIVVPAGDEGLSPTQLRARLLERRDAHSVPTRWVEVRELPRLPNGKVDRQGLAELAPVDRAPAASAPAPPADAALVEQVRVIWEGMLPMGPVGPDDDFFHLGGDSLLAAQMLIVVESELGVTVPMGELVHARTAREVASVVGGLSTAPSSSWASCVQEGDPASRPRLWFVHDLQGSAYRVRHLAEALGQDQPVWSFESPLLAGLPNPYRSMSEFADTYVEHLRRAQPTGPYWLAGYSFGGICAYEVARQLVADGQEVAFVGVVDVGPGYRGPGWHARRSPFRPWFGVAKPPPGHAGPLAVARHYARMATEGPARLARHLEVRTGAFRVTDPRRFRADLRTHGRVRPDWRLWYAWEEHWKLSATAWDRASTYPGRVELFWAEETPSADATMGWRPLVAELGIHRFEGDHEGVLEPRGAHHLAEVLRPVLDATLEDVAEPPG